MSRYNNLYTNTPLYLIENNGNKLFRKENYYDADIKESQYLIVPERLYMKHPEFVPVAISNNTEEYNGMIDEIIQLEPGICKKHKNSYTTIEDGKDANIPISGISIIGTPTFSNTPGVNIREVVKRYKSIECSDRPDCVEWVSGRTCDVSEDGTLIYNKSKQLLSYDEKRGRRILKLWHTTNNKDSTMKVNTRKVTHQDMEELVIPLLRFMKELCWNNYNWVYCHEKNTNEKCIRRLIYNIHLYNILTKDKLLMVHLDGDSRGYRSKFISNLKLLMKKDWKKLFLATPISKGYGPVVALDIKALEKEFKLAVRSAPKNKKKK